MRSYALLSALDRCVYWEIGFDILAIELLVCISVYMFTGLLEIWGIPF